MYDTHAVVELLILFGGALHVARADLDSNQLLNLLQHVQLIQKVTQVTVSE